MMLGRWITYPMPVALLAEGVDRNCDSTLREAALVGRPPRGGRG